MAKRTSPSRLAAPFIVTAGLLPACGGAPPPPTGNPPQVEHQNPPGVEDGHDEGGVHANPPPPDAEPATDADAPAEPEAAPTE